MGQLQRFVKSLLGIFRQPAAACFQPWPYCRRTPCEVLPECAGFEETFWSDECAVNSNRMISHNQFFGFLQLLFTNGRSWLTDPWMAFRLSSYCTFIYSSFRQRSLPVCFHLSSTNLGRDDFCKVIRGFYRRPVLAAGGLSINIDVSWNNKRWIELRHEVRGCNDAKS